MSTERFRFKKFHIDHTWKNKFSNEALKYLINNKEWLYERLNYSINSESTNDGSDFIILLDSGDIIKEQKFLTIRTVIVSSHFSWYEGYDNMFFKNGNLLRAATMNMQSNNEPLKEVANAIVKGAGAVYDDSILFPFTIDTWKKPE